MKLGRAIKETLGEGLLWVVVYGIAFGIIIGVEYLLMWVFGINMTAASLIVVGSMILLLIWVKVKQKLNNS